jgi:hypothetical protein
MNPIKTADGWTIYESEVFPALGLGRAWFAFPPVGYVSRPATPPVANLLDILTEHPPRERGQRQRPRQASRKERFL